MAKEPIITNERVDDIPLLLRQLEHMGVEQLIDKHFPCHGNWQGLNLGSVVVIWLTHIWEQADHRLNHVQAWVSKRLETLKNFTDESLRSLDLADDRLQAVLRYLSIDANWFSFESELGSSLLRVYDIVPEQVRLDSTTASSHCGVQNLRIDRNLTMCNQAHLLFKMFQNEVTSHLKRQISLNFIPVFN